MAKLTPWFPPHIKPVRVGWYNASAYRKTHIIRYWNGQRWSEFATLTGLGDTEQLTRAKRVNACRGDIEWRGLASPPEEKR